MKTQIKLLIIIALTSSMLVACIQPNIEPKEIDLDLKSKALVQADNSFGLELFKQIEKTENGNFNVSPISIALALAMTYNGAKEETKAAMEETLQLSGFTADEINQSYRTLIKALLEADNKVALEIAQSIWYRIDFNVLEDFKSVNQIYYDAEVNKLDFRSKDALDIINGWIEDKTHDKIKDMIKVIDPAHVMFLINAIYFNGEWQSEFDKKNTKRTNFHINSSKSVQVDMMQKTDSVNMISNDLFAAIELPYGKGNFNMVVILPNENITCTDVIKEINAENWKKWMDSFSKQYNVDIWIPKFKDEYEIKLNDVLSYMGMENAFTPAANFTGINGEGGIWIDYVQHNTFIDVNEKGTEAAAATVVAMIEFAAMPNFFHADKPFIYAITEKETGAILFIGKIVEPSYN